MPTVLNDGDRDAPVLVLLHGATANGRMWDPVRRHLKGRYRVLTPDLPGHGSRRGEPYTLARAVETVAEAARSAPSGPIVVVGDSLGGYTAMAAAAALPGERLKGLVLGGCSANFVGSASRALRRRALFIRLLLAILGERRLTGERFIKQMCEMGVTESDARALVAGHMRAAAFAEATRALDGLDFKPTLAAIEQPVLFVNGSKDTVAIEQEPSFLAIARQGSNHRFDNCEHGVAVRRHAEFAGLVDLFCAKVFAVSR